METDAVFLAGTTTRNSPEIGSKASTVGTNDGGADTDQSVFAACQRNCSASSKSPKVSSKSTRAKVRGIKSHNEDAALIDPAAAATPSLDKRLNFCTPKY